MLSVNDQMSKHIGSCDIGELVFHLIYSFFPGILRYRVDFQGMEYQGDDDEFFDLDDY